MTSPDLKIKTPSVQTLGVLLFGLYFFAAAIHAADCMPAGEGDSAMVAYVYDGDTIKLKDGRNVRILGINAPEIDHGDGKPGQSLGDESRRAAQSLFSSNKTVKLFYDQQIRDRYGRTLAHVYDVRGSSLGATLLRSGLAFHVAIPPNMSLNECLVSHETTARRKGLGVWGDPAWSPKLASDLTKDDKGFQRIYGRVLSVEVRKSVWLELDGLISINIPVADLKNFPRVDWAKWKGKRVEVRGWVTERRTGKPSQKNKQDSIGSLVIQPRISSNIELLRD